MHHRFARINTDFYINLCESVYNLCSSVVKKSVFICGKKNLCHLCESVVHKILVHLSESVVHKMSVLIIHHHPQ